MYGVLCLDALLYPPEFVIGVGVRAADLVAAMALGVQVGLGITVEVWGEVGCARCTMLAPGGAPPPAPNMPEVPWRWRIPGVM
jgi:hypothetical protein